MKLLDISEYPFHVVHDFVFDRTRSIRQDLTMQNIVSDQVVLMYEEMVCFLSCFLSRTLLLWFVYIANQLRYEESNWFKIMNYIGRSGS